MVVKKDFFGKTADGKEACLYTLTNRNGLRLLITDFGGRMVQLWLPDRSGRFDDVIMGFDTLDPYLIRNPFFGALVGRCANRINNGSFTLNGKTYALDPNTPPHHLHGGSGGFANKIWEAHALEETDGGKLKLTLASPDGDQGYPGNLQAEVIYTLTADNRLSLEYAATTDADTVVNLTNHNYFNLKGHDAGTVLGHSVRIDADSFLPTDALGIPLAGPAPVDGTPFDLRKMTVIGSRVNDGHAQMAQNLGFDVHYYFAGGNGQKPGLRRLCEVSEPESGRTMEVWTTKPGVQFYTSNRIKDNFVFTGKGGYVYRQYCGFCLETQYPPDSPNNPDFPEIVLHPGEEYRHQTVFAFGCC